jgi:hypothetical protein
MLLRMADEDRATYGGPDELDFGAVPAWLDDLGYDDLAALDDEIVAALGAESPLLWVIYQLMTDRRARATIPIRRVWVWLSLRAAGVDVALADFKPAHLFRLRVVDPPGGAVPPGVADSSSTSSTESAEPTTTSASGSSTDASTPGPGEPTA